MTKRILVADDERGIALLAKRALESKGYGVDAAYNGKDALDIAKEIYQNNQSIDLVISDTDMPIMNGPEFMKEVKGIDSKVKILQITGHKDHSKSKDADSILYKPFEIDDLYNAVEKLLFSEQTD